MFRNEDLSAKKNFDDCYFYFYSTCKKGTSCPFRHCEAALGTEVVCSLWQAGKCFRLSCPLRHMESQRDRSTIACYWENQPGGCRKPHCVFRHCRPREGLDNNNANKDLILPVAVADADENKWTSTPSNRIVVQNSGQEQKNWVITTEEEENSLPLPPAVEPLVVCFDEESDTESCTSTPVKAPDQERRVQLFSGDAVDKIQITSSVRKLNTKKGKLKKSNIELGIKTLQEIREEKTQIGIKPACSSSEDENIIELIGDQSKDVSDSNIDKKAKDLRIKIQQKRTVTTKPDSTTTDKNLDFKIKTLEEIRKEKAQSFKDLDSNTPDKEKDDVNIIQGETKENKAGSLKSRRQTIVRKERNRKASSSEDKITSSVEVTTAKTHPKKLKRQSIEIYRPPKSENVVKEESPTSSKRRKQQDKEKNDAKEFRVKSLDEIREERKLRELQKLKNNKVEIEEEPDKLDTSSLKNRHPRITFKGSNSDKQEKRKSEISPLTPFLNKKSCPLRKSAAEESRDLVNYESDYLESDFHSSNDRLLKNSLRTDSSEEVAPFRKIQETYLYQNVVLNQSQDSPSSNDSLCISSSGMSRSKDEVNSSPLAPSNDSGNGAPVESQLSPSQQSLNLSIEYSIAKETSATESRETVTSTRRKRLESSSSKSADSSKISQRKQSSRDLSDGGIDLEAELSLLLDDDEEDLSTTDLKEEDLLLELDEIINS